MTNIKTQNAINEITEWANAGNEVLPMFFSVYHGRATVSAAIRVALATGKIEQNGVDGCGKPKYIARKPANVNSPWYIA